MADSAPEAETSPGSAEENKKTGKSVLSQSDNLGGPKNSRLTCAPSDWQSEVSSKLDKVRECTESMSADNTSLADRLSVLETERDDGSNKPRTDAATKGSVGQGDIASRNAEADDSSATSSYSHEDFEADLDVSDNENEKHDRVSFDAGVVTDKLEMQTTLT